MGCQPKLVLFAKVLHACTGMEPTGASSLWRSACSVSITVSITESITDKPVAQPAPLCGHGEIYDARRASLLTNFEGLGRVRVDLAGGAGTSSPVASAAVASMSISRHSQAVLRSGRVLILHQSVLIAGVLKPWQVPYGLRLAMPGMCLSHSLLKSTCIADVARQDSTPNHPSLLCQLHDDNALSRWSVQRTACKLAGRTPGPLFSERLCLLHDLAEE